MAYLVYNENEVRTGGGPDFASLCPNKQYKRHLENWFFLRLTLRNGNMIDRHQASKEMAICDRKLEYWQRKPTFDQKQGDADMKELRNKWQDHPRT